VLIVDLDCNTATYSMRQLYYFSLRIRLDRYLRTKLINCYGTLLVIAYPTDEIPILIILLSVIAFKSVDAHIGEARGDVSPL